MSASTSLVALLEPWRRKRLLNTMYTKRVAVSGSSRGLGALA
jgi:hypothetical protein